MAKAGTSKKKGSKIKVIILIIVLVLIALFIMMIISSMSMMKGMTMADTMSLERKDIENTVSVSGIVESQTFKQVSANLQYNVEKINVEVGDKVKAGDVLATLNSDDLQDQIVQQQANIDNSSINTEYSVSNAEKQYNDTLAQINDGSYPEIRSAKITLDNAESALEKAKKNYEDQLAIQGSDKDNQLIAAQKSVDSAKTELDYAYDDYMEIKDEVEKEDYSSIKDLKKAYDDAKKEYNSRYSETKNKEIFDARQKYEKALTEVSYLTSMQMVDPTLVNEASITKAQKTLAEAEAKLAELEAKYDVETTEDTYEKAMETYTKAKADIDSANTAKLKNAERNYERTKASYENAVNSLNSVKNGSETSLESYEDAIKDAQKSVDNARESYNLALKNSQTTLSSLKTNADREKVLSENNAQLIALEILKEKLDDCVITAPCDGTITAVNCTEGSAAVGVMFIIEDLDNLKMTASIKEYSVSQIKPGLDVKVTIPSLNNKEFDGVISKLSPAGIKGANGKSDGSASFSVEILIRDTKDSGVLIGMTSKCTAVTGSASNVFAVGYDSLVEEADGSCYVYTCDRIEGGNGTATARKIPVEIGFESDAELEIISDELTEGMDIITNSGDMTDGGVIILTDAFGEALQSAMAQQ